MAKLSRSHRWKNPCELPTYLQFLEGTSYLKLKDYTFRCSLFCSLLTYLVFYFDGLIK